MELDGRHGISLLVRSGNPALSGSQLNCRAWKGGACLRNNWLSWVPGSLYGYGSKPMGSHFGVGEFTTHFRTYFSGGWDVHWGLPDLDFDPWPCGVCLLLPFFPDPLQQAMQRLHGQRPVTLHLGRVPDAPGLHHTPDLRLLGGRGGKVFFREPEGGIRCMVAKSCTTLKPWLKP